MKLFPLLLAAGLCSFTAASAQTTPTQTPPGTGTASPSAVPSGTAPMPSDPKGAVSPGEVFTTGAPNGSNASDRRAMRRKKDKSTMSDGKGKMKTKM